MKFVLEEDIWLPLNIINLYPCYALDISFQFVNMFDKPFPCQRSTILDQVRIWISWHVNKLH